MSTRPRSVAVVESARPLATARRLGGQLGAHLCEGLAEGGVLLGETVEAYEQLDLLARAERAVALSSRLKGFDEAADRALVARSDEFAEAEALVPDARRSLSELAGVVRTYEEAAHRTERAREGLRAAHDAMPYRLVPGRTVTDLERVWAEVRDADAAVRLAIAAVEHARAREYGLSGVQGSAKAVDAEIAGAERAQKRAIRESTQMARRSVVVAVAGVAVIAAALTGAVGTAWAGVGVAFLPPALEFLRRAWSLRINAEAQVRAAEVRANLASQELLTEAEHERWDRLTAERRLADARRDAAAAKARWHEVAGADDGPDRAQAIVEGLRDREAREQRLAELQAVQDQRGHELTERFLAIGFVPDEDDLTGSLQRLRRLLAIQPEAGDLLEAVAAAERRIVAREALAGLMGTLDLAAMERALEDPAPTVPPPVVIVDDEDEDAWAEVVGLVDRLPASADVSIVTRSAARWQIVVPLDPAAAPAGPRAPAPAAPAPKPPAPEKPWFVSQ
ncbi:MAG: hypothetical protein AB7L84_02480 [Acidimicrobiia bacterium]